MAAGFACLLGGILLALGGVYALLLVVGFGFGDSGCPQDVGSFVSNNYLLGNFVLLAGLLVFVAAVLVKRRSHPAWTALLWIGSLVCIIGIGVAGAMDRSIAAAGNDICTDLYRLTYPLTLGVAVGTAILAFGVRIATRNARRAP